MPAPKIESLAVKRDRLKRGKSQRFCTRRVLGRRRRQCFGKIRRELLPGKGLQHQEPSCIKAQLKSEEAGTPRSRVGGKLRGKKECGKG